jgi:hypothetical protein
LLVYCWASRIPKRNSPSAVIWNDHRPSMLLCQPQRGRPWCSPPGSHFCYIGSKREECSFPKICFGWSWACSQKDRQVFPGYDILMLSTYVPIRFYGRWSLWILPASTTRPSCPHLVKCRKAILAYAEWSDDRMLGYQLAHVNSQQKQKTMLNMVEQKVTIEIISFVSIWVFSIIPCLLSFKLLHWDFNNPKGYMELMSSNKALVNRSLAYKSTLCNFKWQ